MNNVGDLIDYTQRNPGKLNYASGSNGSAGHLAGELLESLAGIAMVHIPYGGAAPAQFGLLAGQTDLMFDKLALRRAADPRRQAEGARRHHEPAFEFLPRPADDGREPRQTLRHRHLVRRLRPGRHAAAGGRAVERLVRSCPAERADPRAPRTHGRTARADVARGLRFVRARRAAEVRAHRAKR